MKKVKVTILLSAIIAIMLLCFSGCASSMSYVYDNASKYSSGDRDISDSIEEKEREEFSRQKVIKAQKEKKKYHKVNTVE